MIDQRKRIFAVNLWLFDLFLTTASFLFAYVIRNRFDVEGHTVMRFGVYIWILAVILPTWAVLLPVFGVYSEPSRPIFQQIRQLLKAVGFAGLVMAAILLFIKRDPQNRIMVPLTLGINSVFLVSYRLAIFRFKKHGALDIRHVAVVGSGPSALNFARIIERHGVWGVKLIGIFEQANIRPVLESGGVDELILVVDHENLSEFTETFLLCEELGVT